MRRGELRLGNIQGDYGKRRPVLVVQTDKLNDTHASVLSCLLSTDLQVAPEYRIDIVPNDRNGLNEASQVMVDKVFAFKRAKLSEPIGTVDDAVMESVTAALTFAFGLSSE